MELQFDTTKIYAIALEGGGAKGSYQVGVWRALQEAGVRYNAVSGTSVGALNGAMMAMNDLSMAEKLWKDIRFSQVIRVDDDTMKRIMNREFENFGQFLDAMRTIRDVVFSGGFDTEPLRNLVAEHVDEEKIRNSGVEFFLSTYSITDHKEMDVDARELDPGKLQDMLLASAYFPAFKQEKIGGQNDADGGVYDAVPINALVSRGYKDLIVIRIYGFGIERRVKIPDDVTITTIAPHVSLGNMLNFTAENSAHNMVLGYYDAQKVLYGLNGHHFYIDRTMTEEEAYQVLARHTSVPGVSLRELNEEILPGLARKLDCEGDYYDLLLALLERMAQNRGISPFKIRTDRDFHEEILQAAHRQTPDKVLDQYLLP